MVGELNATASTSRDQAPSTSICLLRNSDVPEDFECRNLAVECGPEPNIEKRWESLSLREAGCSGLGSAVAELSGNMRYG